MRIGHAGYGGTKGIPPKGWGAVESLIWDYKCCLEELGHEFYIIDTPDKNEVIREVSSLDLDVIHVHNDQMAEIMPFLDVPVCILCSHDANIVKKNLSSARSKSMLFQRLFEQCDFYICCLSEKIKLSYSNLGIPDSRLFIAGNGARSDLFRFTEKAKFPEKSICLGAIVARKRQHLLSTFDFVDLIGPKIDMNFDYSVPQYLGEWSKKELYKGLTQYASLVLLSKSEAAPLVTREALMAGLGVVASESAVADLDSSMPFIDVIPEALVENTAYVAGVIRSNQRKAAEMRLKIRQYAVERFDWRALVAEYARNLSAFLENTQTSLKMGSR